MKTAPMCCQVFYTAVILRAITGTVYILRKQLHNEGAFFISLHTFGFALMLLISEVQSRYKANIIHLIIILAAVGITCIMNIKQKEKATETGKETVHA